MTTFSYTAHSKKDNQSITKGTITASDRKAALSALSDRDLVPILIKAGSESKKLKEVKIPLPFGKRVKSKDIVIFTRQMATMINAGVPIVRSLDTLRKQTESAKFKEVLGAVVGKVEGGAPLSDALELHPKVFSPVYVNMVRAGETAGILDTILDRLAIQVEKDATIKSKLKGAMIYPGVITFITFGAFIFIMTNIIPKLKDIFDQFDSELPKLTRVMLAISETLVNHGVYVAIAAAMAVYGLMRLIHTPKGKYVFGRLVLKMPIFGAIVLKVNIARFARTFSSLAGAGVPVLNALKVTAQSLGNVIIQNGIVEAGELVRSGKPLSASLEEQKVFPPIVTQMTEVGEETGQVDVVLTKVAEFYEEEVDRVIANLTSIIEPLLIIVLGGLVGAIIASVFGPISSLTNIVE
jgi:type IV pilus assembly protein PilC